MNLTKRERRIKALAERSSYVENVLRHSLVADLSSVIWQRDPFSGLRVFNSEVDDSGSDLVLTLGSQVRYVQLKQAHDEKVPTHCSVRLSFAATPGSCVVLMSHSVATLRLTAFRFFGGVLSTPMSSIEEMRHSKAPGRRNAAGDRKIRGNYRDVPVKDFLGPITVTELADVLFPSAHDA